MTTIEEYLQFQFHEGPIKTCAAPQQTRAVGLFQFHEGPIKTSPRITRPIGSNSVSIP